MITKILFTCHGNICRSVSAQYILQDMVDRKNIADRSGNKKAMKKILGNHAHIVENW